MAGGAVPHGDACALNLPGDVRPMGRQFQISRLLSAADREAFRALALNEGITTIQALHAWLTERGYKVSHGAVYNYAKHCRSGFLASMRRQFDTRSDAELRKMLATWA